MEEKKTIIGWIKEHKKQLIAAGVSITAVILAVHAIKKREDIVKFWAELKEAISDITKATDKMPVDNVVAPVKVEEMVEVVEAINPPKLIVVDSTTIDKMPFEVSKHVRNLAPGYHPSPEKIETAIENGIELLPNQTWVKNYTKGLIAA